MAEKKSKYNRAPEKQVEQLTYEEAFRGLEEIVLSLETGEHSLDDSLQLFERGQALAKHCGSLLDQAELKVQKISGDETIPFDVDDQR